MKKINKEITLTIILSIIFITLTILVLTNNTLNLDNQIHSYILLIRNHNLTKFLKFITNLSSATTLILIVVSSLIIIKNKIITKNLSTHLILGFLLNQITKFIFTRPRPTGINLIEVDGYSYPSGHSMMSLIIYGYIIYLISKSKLNKSYKITISIFFITLILLIGTSRIYLGVHYFTDIIGGFLLALIYLLITKNIKIEKK